MDHTEVKTTSCDQLMEFVRSGLPRLDDFRIEIIKDSNGLFVAEMVRRCAEAAINV